MYLDPRIQERPRGLGARESISLFRIDPEVEISRVPGSPFGPMTGNFRGPGQICVFTACSLQMFIVEQFENQKPKCSSLLSQPAHKFLHSAFFFFFKSTNSISSL